MVLPLNVEQSDSLTALQRTPSEHRKTVLSEQIQSLLTDFLELDDDLIGLDQDFTDLGTDSLQAVNFKSKLESRFGCSLRTTLLFDYPNIGLLSGYLLDDVFKLEYTDSQQPSGNHENASEVRPPIAVSPPAASSDDSCIAIVAMAGMFPDAADNLAIWQKAASGECLRLAASADSGTAFAYGSIDASAICAEKVSFVSDDLWQESDPPLRLIYRIIEQMLAEYRLSVNDLRVAATGVFIAEGHHRGLAGNGGNPRRAYQIPLANQISFQLNLKGPSEVVNTFCTSVYVALHHAVQSIRAGECEQALIGGINLIDPQEFQSAADQGLYDELLSQDNQTHSFSERAVGFVRSEGAGLALLKPLRSALADGNRILALVKSSAVHHGGRGYAVDAPNVQAIKATITSCLKQAGNDTDSIDYVEAHGIGNRLADAMELNAIDEAYRLFSNRPDKKWYLSSVKPTLGHPELAAGMASLIKAVKALENHLIPGIAGFDSINSDIRTDHRFILQHQPHPWNTGRTPRRVALNSYAIGGVNSHIVLEEHDRQTNHRESKTLIENSESNTPTDSPRAPNPVPPMLHEAIADIFGIDPLVINPALSPIDYGFDSVKITRFVKCVNDRFDIQLKLAEVLSGNSFNDFFALFQQHLGTARNLPAPQPNHPSAFDYAAAHPISEIQQGLWYIQASLPDTSGFNVPLKFKLVREIDRRLLRQTLVLLLDKFPVLKCSFRQDQDAERIEQIVRADTSQLIIEPRIVPPDQTLNDCLLKLLRKPFDLSTDWLVRLYTLDHPQQNCQFVYFVFHHIVIDGFSAVRFTRIFWQTYLNLEGGRETKLGAPDLAFFDFVAWEQGHLQSAQAQTDLTWWRQQLADLSPTAGLPYDTLPQHGLSDNGIGCEKLTLYATQQTGIKSLAALLKVTPSILLLTIFKLFIYKLSQDEDVVVTTPVAGRPKYRHENGIGCFINLMITRTQVDSDQTFTALLAQVASQFAQGLDHANYPFAKLVPELGMTLLDPGSAPFPISYTYQNIFDELADSFFETHAQLEYDVYQETMDHYTLEVYDFRNSLELQIKYDRSLFCERSIRRHAEYLQHLIAAVIDMPDRPIKHYRLLPAEEILRLTTTYNASAAEFPHQQCVHELFAAQVVRNPHRPAVIFRGQTISYLELAEKSDSLAVSLHQRGFGPNQLIALCLDRSAEMIVAILGILKSGAAYLPIDPQNADDRIAYMLRDGQVALLLTQQHWARRFDETPGNVDCPVIAIEALTPEATFNSPAEAHASRVNPHHLAYVIYTSGSTGKPKGVMISHRSLVNLCYAMIRRYQIDENDRVLQFASLSFDMSVEEIFPYLLAGAAVVVRQEEDLTTLNFYRLVTNSRVTVLNIPPLFYPVIDELEIEQKRTLFDQLRLIAFGGEALPERILTAALQSGLRIFNAYGPTEYTVNATIAELGCGRPLSIGKPIDNTQLYVLDKDLNLVPTGVAGELHLAGEGLALGYLNNASMTTEKFIANPFDTGKLYKTGDRVRWSDNGELQYLGRTDNQIKVRGFRVEPEEIEHALLTHASIANTVVTARNLPNGNQLVAFYVAHQKIDRTQLRAFLLQQLPDYMIPDVFVELDNMPVTANGKIDRKALQSQPVPYQAETYCEPETDFENALADIWRSVLSVDKIGVLDNFFELGGHSLLAIQITLRIHKRLGVNVSIQTLFESANIRSLAKAIAALEAVDVCGDSLAAFENSQQWITI